MMLKQILVSIGAACCLAIGATSTRPATVYAYSDSCFVSSDTYAYSYGDPPQLLGTRGDYDQWYWDMSLYDCTVNLAQVKVKQWGKEVCDYYGAEFVDLYWHWTYFDGTYHYGNLHQTYDCDDLP